MTAARWITEAEVAELLSLPDAIDVLEQGLHRQAAGQARNMAKTHITWGAGDTLHAIGAMFENLEIAGTKSWAHTGQGATPLMLLWSSADGRLLAVIEAFALGQMRTGGLSGVATRALADPQAEVFALLGAGKQAITQLAAVAAVRPLREVRIWSRSQERRDAFLATAGAHDWPFRLVTSDTVEAAADGAGIVTLVTRAKTPFFHAAMAAPGAHINAVGAITPERQEFEPDLLDRARVVAVDDAPSALRLSRELSVYFDADATRASRLRSLADVVADPARPAPGDQITVFKAMGMGISDLALAAEIYVRALRAGMGRDFEQPKRAKVRLRSGTTPGETS